MKYLWAPWRMDYILKKKRKGCFFCRTLRGKRDEDQLILYRGDDTFVVMNRFPYNNGHLMVVPKRHCGEFAELSDEELTEFSRLMKVSTEVLKASFHPQGFNIGINIGKEAGAGEEHLHLHVVPRWAGDTNFMPVLGEAKILPEYLEKTYQRLKAAFDDYFKREKRGKGGRRR